MSPLVIIVRGKPNGQERCARLTIDLPAHELAVRILDDSRTTPATPAGALVLARAGLERQRRGWATKFEMRTPRYTTRVDELPTAYA